MKLLFQFIFVLFLKIVYAQEPSIDGYTYPTVTIGTQIWFSENLKTTKYNDGTPINLITNDLAWLYTYQKDPQHPIAAYCWYKNNDSTYKNNKFGALYNHYAIETTKLCPIGWHVPNMYEFKILSDFLGGDDVAGGKLKESGFKNWNKPLNSNLDTATNSTLFTGLPAGGRGEWFEEVGERTRFWATNGVYAGESGGRSLHYNSNSLNYFGSSGNGGYSVRCLKNNSSTNILEETEQVSTITITPNPASEIIIITGNIKSAKIYNLMGEELLRSYTKEIKIAHLPNGQYFIQFTDDQESIYIQKFVKF